MKNTRTKRLFSVLSAGALITSISAVPVFATGTAITGASVLDWDVSPSSAKADGTTQVIITGKEKEGGDIAWTTTSNVAIAPASVEAGSIGSDALVTKGTAKNSTDDISDSNNTFTVTVPKNTKLTDIEYKVWFTADNSTWGDTGATFTQVAATQVPDQTFDFIIQGSKTAGDIKTEIEKLAQADWAFLAGSNAWQSATYTYTGPDGKDIAATAVLVPGTYKINVKGITPADGYALGTDGFHITVTVTGQSALNATDSFTYYLSDTATDNQVDDVVGNITDMLEAKYKDTNFNVSESFAIKHSDGTSSNVAPTDATTDLLDGDSFTVKAVVDSSSTGAYSSGTVTVSATVKGKTEITAFDEGTVSIKTAGLGIATSKAALGAVDISAVRLPRGLVMKDKMTGTSVFGTPANFYTDEACTAAVAADNKMPTGTYYVKSQNISGFAELDPAYSTKLTLSNTTLTFKVTVTDNSSSDNDGGDSGNTSDTAPDFKEEEMTTSKNSGTGTTFTHPEADVLQDKLNENKGTAIAIGSVTNNKDTIATFSITLPKGSKSVSENQVAQVLNVLNTINTKSASTAATNAVNDLLKKADSKNTQSMPISFSRSMSDFGMSVTVTVPVTSKFTNGGTGLYYYNSSTKALEPQKQTVAIRGGKASFDLTHASEYFLIEGIKDLSAGEGVNDSEDTLSSSDTAVTTAASSEAPVVTAPEVTQAPEVTTAPVVATNPGTGNAPIALAVIPVAVAAAAIIAKKAK